MYLERESFDARHNAIDAAAYIERSLAGFEMDIACVEIECTRKEVINQTNNRCFRSEIS